MRTSDVLDTASLICARSSVESPQCNHSMQFAAVDKNDHDELFRLHKAALGPYVEQLFGWDEAFQRSLFERTFDPSAVRWIVVDRERIGVMKRLDHGDSLILKTSKSTHNVKTKATAAQQSAK